MRRRTLRTVLLLLLGSTAPVVSAEPVPEKPITPVDRQHWSFQPPKRPAVPTVKQASWVRTPVDAFILARLEATGLTPSAPADRLALLWQTRDSAGEKPEDWGVEVRVGTKTTTAPTPWTRRVAIDDAEPFQRFRAELSGLIPGETFEYTVFHHDKPVFHAQSKAPAPPGTPQRFVVFGDAAAGTGEQTAIARRIHLTKPDYVVVTGDIVYMRGRDSEYLARFFPVYNGDEASGVPLLARPSSTRRPGITTSPSATSTSSPTDSPTSTNGRSP